MKSITLPGETLENKISLLLLSAFLTSLPFNHFYAEWLLIFFCMHTLIYCTRDHLRRIRDARIAIIAAPLFAALIFVFVSQHKGQGIRAVSQQLPFILFPTFLSLSNVDLGRYKFLLMKTFAFTFTATVIYLYCVAIHAIVYFHLPWKAIFQAPFLNQNFSLPLDLHATYLSIYLLLATSIFIYLIITGHRFQKIHIASCVILLAGLFQLASRACILAAVIIFLFLIPFMLLEGRRQRTFLVVSLLGTMIIGLFIWHSSSLRERYITDLSNDLSEYRDPGDLTESRWRRWELEWQLFTRSPVSGYGTGSENYILRDTFFKHRYYRAYLLSLNAHSQYLSLMLTEGVVGLLLFAGVLISGFYSALCEKNFLLCCFLLILSVVSVSENLLDLSKGVMFYSFFFSFFWFTHTRRTSLSLNG